jgi:glycosyltransferase involved in cell wall biosynthesis
LSHDRTCDGVICFGGADWWYHNRAHYDLQMMRELSRIVPVLYVNSIGVRIPKPTEGVMFAKRVIRKLKSFRRGVVNVRENFTVMSPVVIPGRVGMALSKRILGPQVRAAARRAGMARPLVWVTCPPAADAVDAISPEAVIYERTDRWEEFPEADIAQIRRYDRFMKQRADLTLYCATVLFDEERGACRRATYVDHGVDFESFSKADGADCPADVKTVNPPRIIFVGGIDNHTFDAPLFVEVARNLPDLQFVLIGSCSLSEGWCRLPNVHLLGRRPYEEVPAYMAAADVLIMPWLQNEWIRACNPVKLKEYLAVGRPVVTTWFEELRRYEGYVHVAKGAGEFARAIRRSLEEKCDAERLRGRVRRDTWQDKAGAVVAELESIGIGLSSRAGSSQNLPAPAVR